MLIAWMGEPRRNGVITPKSLPYVLPTDTLASPGLSLGRGLLPELVPGQAAAPAAEQDEEGSKGCRPPQAPWELPLIPAPAPEKEPGSALWEEARMPAAWEMRGLQLPAPWPH